MLMHLFLVLKPSYKYFKIVTIATRTLSKSMSGHLSKIAVCQFTATNNKDKNLKMVQKLVLQASEHKAEIVFLPEGCDYVANNKDEIRNLAEGLDGSLMLEYKSLAQKHKVWLSIGGFHEIVNSNTTDEKLHNSHILLNERGEIQAVYRKMHLFDVSVPEKNIDLKESTYVTKGCEIVLPVSTPAGSLALGICYDLRFPELSIILRKMGAHILTFPSAFTNTTGEAHWEILLRARAIENQCYVVAAAQYGCHNTTRTSFGQSMIVDPWGRIIAECQKFTPTLPTNESIAIADIDLSVVMQVRQEMPVFKHRRNDMYELTAITTNSKQLKEGEQYMFADKIIPASTVFYSTVYSYAFTNIKCVVPGHVLVSTIRQAKRLENLTPEEASDFFHTVIKVQSAVEKMYSANSSTICLQDGSDAGQTIPHVHCHILPRKSGDFESNDDIYVELAKHDRDNNPQPTRSFEEMSKEACILRTYF